MPRRLPSLRGSRAPYSIGRRPLERRWWGDPGTPRHAACARPPPHQQLAACACSRTALHGGRAHGRAHGASACGGKR
eukprot:scaffold147834_cov43-Tisochrysis_lutea.AAC.1